MKQEHRGSRHEKTGLFVSAQALAQLTGLSPPTIRLRCAGVPTRTMNRTLQYDSRMALQTLFAPEEGDFEHHRTRSEKYRADLLEMELAKLRGETLSREEVENAWVSIVYIVRSKFLALPGEVAPDLAPLRDVEEVERVLLARIEEILKELEVGGAEAVRAYHDAHFEEPRPIEENVQQKEEDKAQKPSKSKKKAP